MKIFMKIKEFQNLTLFAIGNWFLKIFLKTHNTDNFKSAFVSKIALFVVCNPWLFLCIFSFTKL